VTRFALLLSLLALGALALGACDDDETATAETEVITSNFGQDPPGRGRVVVAGGPDACGAYRKGPGAMVVRIDVFQGVVRCGEARRVLKNYYPHDKSTPPWSCVDYGDEQVQCTQPGAAFRGFLDCDVSVTARPAEIRAACPGFVIGTDDELLTPDPPDAELNTLPARKSCGHLPTAPPGDYPLILVEVVKGRVPCHVARRVLKTQYGNDSQDDAIQAALPWRCAGPEGLIVCHTNPGPHHKAIRARFPVSRSRARDLHRPDDVLEAAGLRE
jgi:hypothetical protein